MGYVDTHLVRGERVVQRGRISWTATARPLIRFALALGLSLVVWLYIDPETRIDSLPDAWDPPPLVARGLGILLAIVTVLAGLSLLLTLLERWTTEIVLTNRRLILKTGFIARNVSEMALSKIEGIDAVQSFWGRLLGYGALTVHGTGEGDLVLPPRLHGPFRFRRAIDEARVRLELPPGVVVQD